MKKYTFILCFLFGSLFIQGQTVTELSYLFNNTLAENYGNGPNLIMLDSAGTFVIDTLYELGGELKTVYRFKKNSGLQFNNSMAGSFLDSSFSVELYFKFDELSGYRRVIDWKNRTSDYGAYLYSGELDFYPWAMADSETVFVDQYVYYVLTRNGLTKEVKIYSNAIKEVEFTDTDDDGVIDTSHVLNFYQDDLIAQGEASAGAVAMLDLYNYVLDSATIVHKFDSLQGRFTGIRGIGNTKAPVVIYPNPVRDNITVDLSHLQASGPVNLAIISSTGRVVYKQTCEAGRSYRISTNSLSLPNGIYLVRVESGGSNFDQKFIVRR
jgi:hypothetical protein